MEVKSGGKMDNIEVKEITERSGWWPQGEVIISSYSGGRLSIESTIEEINHWIKGEKSLFHGDMLILDRTDTNILGKRRNRLFMVIGYLLNEKIDKLMTIISKSIGGGAILLDNILDFLAKGERR